MIYFDNAATTFPKPEEVYHALDYAQRNLAFNAGRGSYNSALKCHEIIEKTRNYLCGKAMAKSLVFTSSATHAINYIINGLDFVEGDIVYFSPYDHNAVVRTLYAYSNEKKFIIKQIPLKNDTTLDLEKFEFECMRNKPKAVFCTHVSNVNGYILPIYQIGIISKNCSSTFVVDGAQAFGLIDVNMKDSFIDYYVFAGHKTLYGPLGIAGYFISNDNKKLKLSVFGGTGTNSLDVNMPQDGTIRYEPSSQNVVGIYGLSKSSQWVFSNKLLEREKYLYTYTLNELNKLDDIILYNLENNSDIYTGIISFNIKGFSSEDVSQILSNDYDICVRSGYHCCPFIHEKLDTKKYLGTVRISFGYFNTQEEVDNLIYALEEIIMG